MEYSDLHIVNLDPSEPEGYFCVWTGLLQPRTFFRHREEGSIIVSWLMLDVRGYAGHLVCMIRVCCSSGTTVLLKAHYNISRKTRPP